MNKKTLLIALTSFALGSWFGDDLAEIVFDLKDRTQEARVEVKDSQQYLLDQVKPRTDELYAHLLPAPAEYAGKKIVCDVKPFKDRHECHISIKGTKKTVAIVHLWKDGRISGGWL